MREGIGDGDRDGGWGVGGGGGLSLVVCVPSAEVVQYLNYRQIFDCGGRWWWSQPGCVCAVSRGCAVIKLSSIF